MVSEPLTTDERATLKRAAFGAVYLVSNADPGFMAMLRESAAASGAFTDTTGLLNEVLTTGALPKLPRDDPEAAVLPALRESLTILSAKAPDLVDAYRSTVLAGRRALGDGGARRQRPGSGHTGQGAGGAGR